MKRWFGWLYEIFPDLNFEVKRVLVRGWPWNTAGALEWVDRATATDGVPYVNEGTHVLRLRPPIWRAADIRALAIFW